MKTKLLFILIASTALLSGCNKKQEESIPVNQVAGVYQVGGECGGGYVPFQPASESAVRKMLEGKTGLSTMTRPGVGMDVGGRIYYRKTSAPVGEALRNGIDGLPSNISFSIRDDFYIDQGRQETDLIKFGVPLTYGNALNNSINITFDTPDNWLTVRINGQFNYDTTTADIYVTNKLVNSGEFYLGKLNISSCSLFVGQ